MHLSEYQNRVKKFYNELGSPQLNLAHMAMGLSGEFDELKAAINNKDEVGVIEELGDWCWYGATAANITNIPLVVQTDVGVYNWEHLVLVTSKIVDMIKRFVAYGTPLDPVKFQNLLQQGFEVIINFYDNSVKPDFERILDRNIAKLDGRYNKGKFNKEQAVNRDLDAERKILESKDGNP